MTREGIRHGTGDGADTRWSASLPHLVSPLPDEWLPGLLLRCDEANGWPVGTTASLVVDAHHTNKLRGQHRPRSFVMARALDVPKLADITDRPVAEIVETTFGAALLALFPAADFSVSTDRFLAVVSYWRICPACVAEQRLLGRFLALPLVEHCPLHGIAFVSECRCGVPLDPVKVGGRPFACHACGSSWDDLPRVQPDAGVSHRSHRAWDLYELFLTRRDATLIETVRDLAWTIVGGGMGQAPDLLGWPQVGPFIRRDSARSLTELVGCLAFFGVSSALLAGEHGHVAGRSRRCLNRACRMFDVTGAGNLHATPIGRDRLEFWCHECGARHLDHQLYLCYDPEGIVAGGGAGSLSPESIAFARSVRDTVLECVEAVCRSCLAAGPFAFQSQEYSVALAALPAAPDYWIARVQLDTVINHFRILGLAVPTRDWQVRGVGRPEGVERPDDPRMTDTMWADLLARLPEIAKAEKGSDHSPRALLNAVRFIVRNGPKWYSLPDDLPPVTDVRRALSDWHATLPPGGWSLLSSVWTGLLPNPAAPEFANGVASVRRYMRRRATEEQPRRTLPGRAYAIGNEAAELLRAQVAAYPGATRAEHSRRWAEEHGVLVHAITMGKTLARLGIPLNKIRVPN